MVSDCKGAKYIFNKRKNPYVSSTYMYSIIQTDIHSTIDKAS